MEQNTRRTGGLLRKAAVVLILLLFVGVLAVSDRLPAATAAENDPTLEISYHNLSYQAQTMLMYAVRYTNVNPSKQTVELLFWDEPRADGYVKGTEDRAVTSSSRVTINGEPCLVFYSEGLSARRLTDTFYTRACVTVGGTTYYSEPTKYSAIQYITDLLRREDVSEADHALVASLADYGGAAQTRFSYHTERMASTPHYYVRVEGQTFDDGFDYALVPAGTEIPLSVEPPAGATFRKWVDQDGEVVAVSADAVLCPRKDETVHAVFGEPIDRSGLAGRSFTAADNAQIPYFFPQEGLTVEAAICVPKSTSTRVGVLLGNYGCGDTQMNVELYTNGRLRLFMTDGTKTSDLIFSTDLRGTAVKHIALTIPEKKSGTCCLYVDGVLRETKTMPCDAPFVGDTLRVGGDYRDGNTQYFKSRLYELTILNGVRSALAVADDARFGVDADDGALAVRYVFDGVSDGTDLGACGKDLTDTRAGFHLDSISDRYTLTKTFATVPRTYEAIIDTNADVSNSKGCTIVGNYIIGYTPGISFRVYLDGRPSLCLRYDRDHQDQFTFPSSILGKGRVHIAITIDDTYVYGYLNGKQVLKKAHCGYLPELTPYPFSLGCDNRGDNSWWFRDGDIHTVRLYSEYRSAAQIVEDMNYLDAADPTLMLAFDFEQSDAELSAAHNELSPYFYDGTFVDPSEYDYTFAVVGDTQSVVKLRPDELHCIYDFILDQKDTMKIDRVIGLGDITEDNTADQWELASQQMFRLDGILPFSAVRGNHDLYARTEEAEATRELMFGYYFDNEIYRRQFDGSYNGGVENTYTRFTVGGIPYLLLSLDFGPADEVLEWANGICDQFPNDNVIINTHCFLFHDGTTLDATDICPPSQEGRVNDADVMWDEFVSLHENIVLVLCGHDPCDEIVVSKMTGVHGNTVTCVLINPQYTDFYDRPSGMIALLHFKDGGHTILVENYSTIEEKFYKPENQLTIENVNVLTNP